MPEEPPKPAAPAKRLAPEGVFYAIQAFSVTTDDGVRGIPPGTPVRLVKDGGATLRVTDGQQEFDAKREYLTNDLDIAAQAAGQQARLQAANAEWHEKQQALAAVNKQEQAAVVANSLETGQRNIAIQTLRNRDAALASEYTRTQQTITDIMREPDRAVHNLRHNMGTTSWSSATQKRDEVPKLKSRLSAITAERRSIATQLRVLGN